MDSSVYRELDDVKAEVEKLREQCRVKTQLIDSLKRDRGEECLKFQEARQQAEKQARELLIKCEEICELTKVHEDLKSSLHEKEIHIAHLSSENKKIQANCAERLVQLEEVNRKLVLDLDELAARNTYLQQNFCASSKEISGLKTLLLATEKKCLEAEEKAQEARILRQRDDAILRLEEENISVQDKIKWRNEQFKHLEEAHEKLQVQFRSSKEEWEKERSVLLGEVSSLQISLDSQTRIAEGLRSRLEMCNHALAHEESKRKLLEAEISEFKSSFEDVFAQCEEKKSEIQQLTILRNEEIAELRNSLGEKVALAKELERKIVHLEQDNRELGDSLKELREAQIHNAGANSLTSKLRNKLKRLEEVHKNCSSVLKSKESQWSSQVEKMEADISTYKSTLTTKEQEIRELQGEVEKCYYAIEENHLELLIFKSELAEANSKSLSAETDKALRIKENEDMACLSREQLRVKDNSLKDMAQRFLLEEELDRQKKMLEESSEGQLVLKGQPLQLENTLKYEKGVAREAFETLKLEMANKDDELSRLDCELQNWKSTAETLNISYEEIQGACKKMEASLLSQIEKEQVIKHENENLLRIVKDRERKTEDLQQQITLLEMHNAEKMEEAERFKQENNELVQVAEQKDCCIKDLQKDIAIAFLKQESVRKEKEGAILAQLDAEKALEQEKEKHLKIKDEKDQTIKHFQELAKVTEQDLLDALCFAFSKQVENWVEVSALNEALKNAEYMTQLAFLKQESTRKEKEGAILAQLDAEKALVQEKEMHLKIKDEKDQTTKQFQELATAMEQDLLDALCFAYSKQVEKWVEVSAHNEALKNTEYMTKLAISKQESMRKEKEDAILEQLDAEKALEQEKAMHLMIEDEKDQTAKHFQELATVVEQDLLDALCFAFSKQVEKWVEVSALTEALQNAEYMAKLEVEEKNMRIAKSELEINNLLENFARNEQSFFHLKQESKQLQASLEATKLETEKLTDKQQSMEGIISELKFEKENLLQDIMKLSTERGDMLELVEDVCDRIGELSSEDMQLMEKLGNIFNTSIDENETVMDSVVCVKLHGSSQDRANGFLFPPTIKRLEENLDGRSPLREVNSLHT